VKARRAVVHRAPAAPRRSERIESQAGVIWPQHAPATDSINVRPQRYVALAVQTGALREGTFIVRNSPMHALILIRLDITAPDGPFGRC
jgi:hypothetical protein